MADKKVYVIAGSNGSGKTTFANKFLPDYVKCPFFINADLIASGLSPFAPQKAAIKAGRLVLEQIDDLMNKGVDFAFETTLSGKGYRKHFEVLKESGYGIYLFYLWIPSFQLAVARIKDRVSAGGHNVPSKDVKRRFARSLSNLFRVYRPLLDSWMIFDNSGIEPLLIAMENTDELTIKNKRLFTKIISSIGVRYEEGQIVTE